MFRHTSKLGSHSTLKSMKPSTLAQLILLASILSVKVADVCGTSLSAPELRISVDSGNVGNAPANDGAGMENKRSWQSLQGSWGKRAGYGSQAATIPPTPLATADDDEILLASDWVPVVLANGDHLSPQMREALVYVISANALERYANERLQQRQQQLFQQEQQQIADELAPNQDMLSSSSSSSFEDAESSSLGGNGGGSGILNEKRAWKNLNAGWGKRRNAPAWNKFSGAWGKREPGWNNLKGMWGKRAAKDWQKLHGGWGRR